MIKEIIKTTKEDFDYTSMNKKGNKFKLGKETFTFVMKERVDGDGEWWRIIVQRKSDKKFFEYSWGYAYGSGNYYYEDNLDEVFETKEIKTIEIFTYN